MEQLLAHREIFQVIVLKFYRESFLEVTEIQMDC